MILFKKVYKLQNYLTTLKSDKKSIGFVPTMGALHSGHLSLIQKAKEENDCVVCSIFVNPTQFNNATDLEKYPRTAAKDIELLTSVGTDVLLMPPVKEVYPDDLDTTLELDFGKLATTMEGEFRPGHFDGMAQVVNRMLNMVKPHSLYMGQKDFQQFSIIQKMLNINGKPTRLKVCPIVRESDGLAMSSRNTRLTKNQRDEAPFIYKTLNRAKEKFKTESINTVTNWVKNQFKNNHILDLEYFEIANEATLKSAKHKRKDNNYRAFIAVFAGEVRLIDNMAL